MRASFIHVQFIHRIDLTVGGKASTISSLIKTCDEKPEMKLKLSMNEINHRKDSYFWLFILER